MEKKEINKIDSKKKKEEKIIKKVQKALDKEKSPIKILTVEKLQVEYGGFSGRHAPIVTKKAVENFNKTWWGCLGENGELVGDWREVKKIKDECERVFKEIEKEKKKEKI